MPKSKRVRRVHLTKVKSKGAELKTTLVDSIREAVDTYAHIYVFSYENMRTTKFKNVRAALRDSRIFLGKNKVMQLALGKSPESAYRDNMELLSKELSGLRGLLFTNKDRDAVREIFDATAEKDFARSGFKCSEKVTLSAGPLTTMAHSMVEQLRKAGLQVILVRGVVTLEEDHCICRPGDILNPDQAHLLKLFDHKVAEFRLKICAQWSDGKFQQ